ncbi:MULTISPECIES: caspase family protein [unclassified Bradyrhizobium]|uniref:caspase family protein n=1 Tax=unclassified Bradyrhizobium TaxID=2631580 RepID=UPI0023B1D089|nr:caspase family protein [Bradyrhizobium sp. CSS354]MDE5464901.1 hypothetical protein [Bradyrhizobium sp. CSS354]
MSSTEAASETLIWGTGGSAGAERSNSARASATALCLGRAVPFSSKFVVRSYRKPSNGDALPSVAFAHADADGIRDAVLEIFKHLPAGDVEIEVMKDTDASLIAVKDHLAYKIHALDDDALFIFYYAGHGFYGAGGNRLSTYDSNRVTDSKACNQAIQLHDCRTILPYAFDISFL